jgi:hypothetical protein
LVLPACDAVMITGPPPTIVNTLPEIVAMPVWSLLYDTGRPELAVAVSVIGAPPKVAAAKGAKVIVCASCPTVNG